MHRMMLQPLRTVTAVRSMAQPVRAAALSRQPRLLVQQQRTLKWFSTEADKKSTENDKPAVEGDKPAAEQQQQKQEKQETQADERDKTIETLRAEGAELKDKYLRALAEVENTRRLGQERVEDAKKFALQGFSKDLLEVADVLQLALDNVPEAARTNPANKELIDLYEGLTSTKAILDKIFARHNLLPMDPLGEKFDPNYHQAIFQMPVTDGKKPGTVGAVVKKGYTLNGRTIRAAGVGVIQAEES